MPGHAAIDLARQFVERKLEPWPAFEAALIKGSTAHGEAREDSDVDMVLVFDADTNPLSRPLPSGGRLTLRLRREAR